MKIRGSGLTLLAALSALPLATGAGCDSASPEEIRCGEGTSSNGGVSCSCSLAEEPSSVTCDDTVAPAVTCCASADWPAGGSCLCQEVTCKNYADDPANAGNPNCYCRAGGGGTGSCSLPTGVCCSDGSTCTCYIDQTSCGSSSLKQVDSCTPAAIGCEAWGSELPLQVTSCSP